MRRSSIWLYEGLKSHPDIRVSEFKEVDFFFLHRMRRHDLVWYEAQFEPSDGVNRSPFVEGSHLDIAG